MLGKAGLLEETSQSCRAVLGPLNAGNSFLPEAMMEISGQQQVLHHHGNYLVRRQRLEPGEATPWHRDPCHRVTVVLSGDLLEIEFRHSDETMVCKVTPGDVDWGEPTGRVHRAVDAGEKVFEEVVTYFLDRPDSDPQPEPDK